MVHNREKSETCDEAFAHRVKISLLPVWRRLNRCMGDRLGRHGLPPPVAVALLSIYAGQEEAEPAVLAEQLFVPRQTMTVILDTLEQEELAERHPHPVDRRRKLIVLTPAGREKATAIINDMFAYESAAARIVFTPNEIAPFRRTVMRLADAMEQLNQEIKE